MSKSRGGIENSLFLDHHVRALLPQCQAASCCAWRRLHRTAVRPPTMREQDPYKDKEASRIRQVGRRDVPSSRTHSREVLRGSMTPRELAKSPRKPGFRDSWRRSSEHRIIQGSIVSIADLHLLSGSRMWRGTAAVTSTETIPMANVTPMRTVSFLS